MGKGTEVASAIDRTSTRGKAGRLEKNIIKLLQVSYSKTGPRKHTNSWERVAEPGPWEAIRGPAHAFPVG